MEVKSLDTVHFSVLMDCFLAAFENYYVKMPTNHEYYKDRWKIANVRLDLSYGMFDNEKLVGFIVNAIDDRNGNTIAFNTGTGVLPIYRRQGIVHSIYQFAIPKLKEHGVSKCRLEVIKENHIAIKAYRRIGFKITKSYKCFNGDIMVKNNLSDVKLKKVNSSYFDWTTLQQNSYSWDNYYKPVMRGVYEYYIVVVNATPESYFIINSKNGYIAQFNVLEVDDASWIRLFTAIRKISKNVKINNVDEALIDKIDTLNAIQLKNTVDQYEMELDLFIKTTGVQGFSG